MTHLRVLSLLGVALTLGACASSKDEAPKPVRLCPQVAIVRDLESFRDFGSGTAGQDEPVAAGLLRSVEGGCAYGDKGGVDVRFTLSMLAERKDGQGGGKAAYPYFVSLVGPDGKVVKKTPMTAAFEFGKGEKKAEAKEKLHIFVPVDKDMTAEGYRILLGFQLTEDQLNAARDRKPK